MTSSSDIDHVLLGLVNGIVCRRLREAVLTGCAPMPAVVGAYDRDSANHASPRICSIGTHIKDPLLFET